MKTVRIKHPVIRFLGRLIFCVSLATSALDSRGACQTNIPIGNAINIGDGPLASPSAQFPFIAYRLNAKYANFYNQAVAEVKTDECMSEAFSRSASGSHQEANSLVSLSSVGGKPEFRFRAKAALGKELADQIVAHVGADGRFRFRDVVRFNNPGTNPLNVAVTISMNGNVSRPLAAIPTPEQQGDSTVKLLVEDLTFCQPGPLINVSHRALTQGPDYFATYVVTVCPTAVIRVDLQVDLNATVMRFVTIGGRGFSGGYTFADYTQCVSGNSVCFEDCVDPDLESCSGFSIRVQLVDPPAGAAASGTLPAAAAGAPVELVSAAGYDYSAPLPVYKPSLRIRQFQGNSLVQWPSGASEWKLAASPDMSQWNAITNQPGFDREEGMFQLTWPLTNQQQFFRLEKTQ